MSLTSIGDLATSMSLRRHSGTLRREIDRLSQQLASGQLDAPQLRTKRQSGYLADLETGLTRVGQYVGSTAEAALSADAMQASLEHLGSRTSELSGLLLGTSLGTGTSTGSQGSDQATEALPGMIDALNVSVAGRSLFAGTAWDVAPLASADDLLDGVRTAIGGLTTVADIRTAAIAWFDSPTGFDAAIYAGGTSGTGSLRISNTRTIDLDVQANDASIKALLRETVLAALAEDSVLALPPDVAVDLRASAGAELAAAQSDLVDLRSKLGRAQSSIEDARAENAATRTGLLSARTSLLAADPFEAATSLELAQTRLEALYSVTARTANLKLVNYL